MASSTSVMLEPKGLHSMLGFVALLFFLVPEAVQAGEYCHFYYYSEYCTYGCCGSTYDQECCSVSVGIIVAGVIAGIIGLAIIIAIVCCLVKKQGHAGRVVHPGQPANASVVISNTNTTMAAQQAPPPYYSPAYPPAPQQWSSTQSTVTKVA